MIWLGWTIKVIIAGVVAFGILLATSMVDAAHQFTLLEQARPAYTPADVATVAVVLTFEAQVFPEPDRSRAFRAIAWTMRNRVASRYQGATGYADDAHLLNAYRAYGEHRNDNPSPAAVAAAQEVLSALTSADDETRGARHYVDNSYWTGTHEQTGVFARMPGMHSDVQVRGLADDGLFSLTIEWKSSPGYPKGLIMYGLYFFDGWPPPEPREQLTIPLYRTT